MSTNEAPQFERELLFALVPNLATAMGSAEANGAPLGTVRTNARIALSRTWSASEVEILISLCSNARAKPKACAAALREYGFHDVATLIIRDAERLDRLDQATQQGAYAPGAPPRSSGQANVFVVGSDPSKHIVR